jgi:predicted ATPase
MKVLITGAYSTGKTTFVQNLAMSNVLRSKFLQDVLVREDSSRQCPLPLNRQQTIHTSLWLAGHTISEESRLIQESTQGTLMLCDRGMPDFLSHTPSESSASAMRLEAAMWELASAWMPTYSLVFLSRVNNRIPISSDALRVLDPAYRNHLEQKLLNCLERLNCRVIELPHSIRTRIQVAELAICPITRE